MSAALRTSYANAARMRVAERTFARRTEEATTRHGLTPQRYLLLLLIKVAGDSDTPATVTALGRQLQTTQSSVTQLVQGAEAAGLLHRVMDTRDARRQHLFLTDEGAGQPSRAFVELGDDRIRLAETIAGLAADDGDGDRQAPDGQP